MTDFLNSVRADLTDRRVLPIVGLVVLALVGAIAYVALGGSSAPATPSPVAATVPGTPPGLAVTQTTPEKAVAEVTEGAALQHKGGSSRDPFAAVPGTDQASTTSASSSSSSSKASSAASGSSSANPGSTGSSSGSPSTGSGGSTPTPTTPSTPSKPSSPSKPQTQATVYHVAVLFGPVTPEASSQASQLTPYENLKLLTPLPSPKQPLIVFRGVTSGGKSATFSLVSEAILHGNGACVPSTSQCQAVELRTGQSEQLQYISEAGQSETYELKVVSIAAAKASSADAKGILSSESKVGREVLDEDGLTQLPDLRYSTQAGVLVFAGHPAFGAGGRSHGHQHS
jgi:hypothetical protein